MCPDCKAMVQNKRGADGHANLEVTGKDKAKPFAQAVIRITFSRCRICGTNWRYEDDKNDSFAGWSVQT
jgi:hypothetical protein